MAPGAVSKQAWWKEEVIYQVYPASFKDSNGDGWGDVKGITEKLDYLKDLGVDIVWTSPIYKSPQADMGYDIADYYDIDYRYGKLEDVDELIAELKKRDMKLMMDLVVNHTSDQHAWFLESRSSKDNPKRDWYIWKKPKFDTDGEREPPNNWGQLLGEAQSAWTWDDKTGEYYLSIFSCEQPDLNWENPEVRKAVHDIMRFWLDRGCCGFRMDVINLISKVPTFPDGPVTAKDNKYQPGHMFYANGPRMHEYLQEINREVLSKYDTITVGESPFVKSDDEILKMVGADSNELRMIFIFDLVTIDDVPGGFRMDLQPWAPANIVRIVDRLQRLMIDRDGWNSVFIENHDQPRSVSRYVDDSDNNREVGAKLLCMMQITFCGTLYVYQGEELGLRNMPLSWGPEEYKDIETINYWKKMNHMYPSDESKLQHARKVMQAKARDHARYPVHWDDSPNAGFCPASVKPWMRVNDDYKEINAKLQANKSQGSDPSVLQFWRKGLALRKELKDIIVYGDFQTIDGANEKLFAYKRVAETGALLVVLNFTGHPVDWAMPGSLKVKEWVLKNVPGSQTATSGTIKLNPWEGLIGRLD